MGVELRGGEHASPCTVLAQARTGNGMTGALARATGHQEGWYSAFYTLLGCGGRGLTSCQ